MLMPQDRQKASVRSPGWPHRGQSGAPNGGGGGGSTTSSRLETSSRDERNRGRSFPVMLGRSQTGQKRSVWLNLAPQLAHFTTHQPSARWGGALREFVGLS